MNQANWDGLRSALSRLRVLVVGDACLDLYWRGDMTQSTLSRETPHFPLPVVEERIELGAAANVAQGFACIEVARVDLVSVVGLDWRGNLLIDQAKDAGIGVEGVVRDRSRWTPAYVKPTRTGWSDVVYEDPRLDFISRTPLSPAQERAVLERLNAAMERHPDVVVVVDQLTPGVVTAKVREWLTKVGANLPVLADSRERIAAYRGVITKPNHLELWQAMGDGGAPNPDWQYCAQLAGRMERQTGAPVCVTLGAAGAVYVHESEVIHWAAETIASPVDIVGAGDAFLVGFAAAWAVTGNPRPALELGTLAAGVVVRQLRTAGRLSLSELEHAGER